jgi:hypothetical protein
MFEWDSVFARHEKFDRPALAKARDTGSSARIDPAAEDLAKLPAKAEIAEKDVFAQILYLVDCHRQRRDFTTVASSQAPDQSR